MQIEKIEIITQVEPTITYKYKVEDKEFISLKQAEYYIRYLLYRKLFKDIKHINSKFEWFDREEQDWYYCESLDHLLAVIGSFSADTIPKINDIKFPQWICVLPSDWGDSGNGVEIVEFEEFKKEVDEGLEFIKLIEEQ